MLWEQRQPGLKMFINASTFFLLGAFQHAFPLNERTWAHKVYRKFCRMLNKLQEQQIISVHKGTFMGPAKPAEGPMWTNVLMSPYPEAHSIQATKNSFCFQITSHKNNSNKSMGKVCTKILREEARTHFSFSCCIYSFQCLWACTCCWGQTRRKRRQCQTPGHNYSPNRVILQHHSKHK